MPGACGSSVFNSRTGMFFCRAGRMQVGCRIFAPKMGQFGSFVESESAYRRGCGYDPRIVAVQSVDVGHLWISQASSAAPSSESGVIASAPLQVVYFARSVAANVALGNENPVEGITVYGFARMFPDKSHVRLPAFVRPYEIDCRQQGGMYPVSAR